MPWNTSGACVRSRKPRHRPGPWSDTVTLTMTQDTEPPNTPSMPTVTTDLRIVTVELTVSTSSAKPCPSTSTTPASTSPPPRIWSAPSRSARSRSPDRGTRGSWQPDVPVWVAVSAVDQVGNESAMTPAQSVTPQKLVDDSSIRDELDRHRRQDQQCGR